MEATAWTLDHFQSPLFVSVIHHQTVVHGSMNVFAPHYMNVVFLSPLIVERLIETPQIKTMMKRPTCFLRLLTVAKVLVSVKISGKCLTIREKKEKNKRSDRDRNVFK